MFGLAYSYINSILTSFGQNFLAFIFSSLLFAIFLFAHKLLQNDLENCYQVILPSVSLHLGILLSPLFFEIPNSFFWVQDSISSHVPASMNFSNFFLNGNLNLETVSSNPGSITHAISGLFFSLFGVNVISSGLTTLILKILAMLFIFLISKELWNRFIAGLSVLIFSLAPTIFYYDLVFYKESAVHFLFSASLYFIIKLFDKKYFYAIPLVIVCYLLSLERFYLAVLIFLQVLLISYYYFWNSLGQKWKKIVLAILTISLTIPTLMICYEKFHIQYQLDGLRKHYSSFQDVQNNFNYNIPYPLAFIKILFSPYFTPNKFTLYSDLSLLLLWGSFINQFYIISSIAGLFNLSKKNLLHLLIWFPFIVFLLFAAHISPWSGRLRDSFYPIIAIYAAYYLYHNKYFRKFFITDKA